MTHAPPLRPDVAAWLRGLAELPDDPILTEMHALAAARRFPIVGPEVGRLLAQVTTMTGARRVFEMGSGFGYSTLWFARAVGPNGRVYHTDGDPENTRLAKDFLTRAGLADRVMFLTGDAREHLTQATGQFDIVFCDIDKEQYPSAYELFRGRVRVGGAVIVDNLVWSGRVAAGETDADTEGVREYIRLMWADPEYLSSLLPVRDGVGLSLRHPLAARRTPTGPLPSDSSEDAD
ncbi:MAG: O-methyltransferase [Deltaproteobacteria bacterium]|nr:O-methyltransferase [Deltaproteobacteria bacterium]